MAGAVRRQGAPQPHSWATNVNSRVSRVTISTRAGGDVPHLQAAQLAQLQQATQQSKRHEDHKASSSTSS